MLKNDLSIIVVCYDPYSDAIKLSPYFFHKNWSSCDLDVIYVTSNIKNVDDAFITTTTDGDLTYCGRVEKALSLVKTDFVMLLLDDYLVDKKVDNDKLQNIVNYLRDNSLQYCQLFTMFKRPPGHKNKDNYLEVSEKIKYRINLQPSIYKTDLVRRLISKKPNTAWDAEMMLMGDEFKDIKSLFSLNHPFSVLNYIDKGYVTRKAVRVLKKNGLWENQRKVMPFFKSLKKATINSIYFLVPRFIVKMFKRNNELYKG